MSWVAKVYVVQRADREGNLLPEVPVAIKLRFEDAFRIAGTLGVAPAKVTRITADKGLLLNGSEAHLDPRLLSMLDPRVKPHA